MSKPDEIARVLETWGEGSPEPMNGAVGQGVADAVFDVVRSRPDVKSICDLGCGGGHLAGRLGRAGYSVEGVDASAPLVAVATEHHGSERVHFRQSLIDEPLARELAQERLFDLVVSSDVIEHMYRPRTMIDAAAAMLRPGGHLVICTPYNGYLKNVVIALLGRFDHHHGVHWDGGHIKFFSPRTLAEIVSSRFEVERFFYHGRLPWLWKNMIIVATKRA